MKKTVKTAMQEYFVKHGHEKEKMEQFSTLVYDFFDDLQEMYPEVSEAFAVEIEDLIYELDEETVCEAIKKLRFKDGTHADMKWTKEDTSNVAKQYGVKEKLEGLGEEFCELKFWFAMNYVYATHFSVNRGLNGYIDLAVDELSNKNVKLKEIVKTLLERV